jgi:hypothetical protein
MRQAALAPAAQHWALRQAGAAHGAAGSLE